MQPDNEIWSINRYKIRNIFLEKLYRKCGGEARPKTSYQKSKLSISLNQQSELLQLLLNCLILLYV